MPGLGEAFRAAREARNLSLSDVAEQIHIRAVYLQAIEEEDWSAIAAPVYVRGFIRTYARFLGLDPQSAVEQFNAVAGEPAAATPIIAAPVRSGPSPWLWAGGAIAAILVGLVVFNYLQLQRSGGSDRPLAAGSAAASPSPAATASALVAAASAASSSTSSAVASGAASVSVAASPSAAAASKSPAPLAIDVTQKSWLRVIVDGTNKDEGVFDRGAHLQYAGKSATVRTGNAGGIAIKVNGKDQGSLGKPGDVVERTYELAHG